MQDTLSNLNCIYDGEYYIEEKFNNVILILKRI